MITTTHLHPMLVHFPIALIIAGFIVDVASVYLKRRVYLPELSFYLLLFGTLSAIFSLLSGIFFTTELSGTAHEVQETHELFAWMSVGILIVTLLLRLFIKAKQSQKSLKWLAFALYGLATICISVTGFYGGTLVYNYMMTL